MVLLLATVISGCSTMGGADIGTRLLGEWQSDLAGFTLVTSYTADTVMVKGQAPHPYSLEGDLLIIAGDRTTARRIAFPARNEMTQTDLITGTVHAYLRVRD